MAGVFIAAYVLFGVMAIIGAIYLYTLFMYTKGVLFTKTKYNPTVFAFYFLIFVILIIIGSLFASTLKNKLEHENCTIHTALCFSFAAIAVVNCIIYIFIIRSHNKTKIPYDQIDKTDFKSALDKLKQEIGDVEVFKNKLQKHHKKWFNSFNLAYLETLKRAKDEKISRAEKLADIVMLNDTFSHKWCTLTNNYQHLLIYQLLEII